MISPLTIVQLSYRPIAVWLIVAALVEEENKNLLFLWQNFFSSSNMLAFVDSLKSSLSTGSIYKHVQTMYELSFGHLLYWPINVWQTAWEENKKAIIWHMFFPMWLLISIYLWFLNTLTFDQLSLWPIAVWLIVSASAEEENKNLLFLGHNFFLLTCLVMSTHSLSTGSIYKNVWTIEFWARHFGQLIFDHQHERRIKMAIIWQFFSKCGCLYQFIYGF